MYPNFWSSAISSRSSSYSSDVTGLFNLADSENEIDTDDEEFIEHEEEIYIKAKQILIYTSTVL